MIKNNHIVIEAKMYVHNKRVLLRVGVGLTETEEPVGMTEKEWNLAWLKVVTQRWEAKHKPLLEDGTKVWIMSITFPLSLNTYSMYAFLSLVSNLCWVSFHSIFGPLNHRFLHKA